MKPNELRLGNLVSLVYDPEKFGVVIAIDLSGSVHLSNKESADDVRDITGVELTESLLEKLGYDTVIYTGDHEITLKFTDKRVMVTIDDDTTCRIRFFHELQNVVFAHTGFELLDAREFLYR